MRRAFFAGVLRLSRDTSWDRLALELTLMGAQRDRAVACTRARAQDEGGFRMAVFICVIAEFPLQAADVRRDAERFLDVPFEEFGLIEPHAVDDVVLALLAEAADAESSHRITAAAIEPAPQAPAHQIIGLAQQQRAIADIGLVLARFGRDALEGVGFAFLGGPGSGKTELARDLVRRLDALGVTNGAGNLVRADLSALVGRYVGHTAPKTRALVERAVGGVLYIDEAYGLMASTFGQECITTLVDQLDVHRRDVVCVLAGYPRAMEELLDSNEGLRERIPYRLTFPGYTAQEHAEIFRSFARAHRFEIERTADEGLVDTMRSLKHQRGFAEARSVRNLFQDAVIACARRGSERTLDADDIACALARRLEGSAPVRNVGFR